MRALFFSAIAALALFGPAYASNKIVTFTAGTPPAERLAGLEKIGGKVLADLPLINSVMAEFHDMTMDMDILACAHVCAVEDDKVVNWLQEAPAPLPLSYVEASLFGSDGAAAPVPAAVPPAPKAPVPGKEIPWGVKRVNAYSAWDATMGRGVKVAVIDTGVDYSHPDLRANYAGGYNAVDPSKTPLDDNGHGTHVAGIIGAALDGAGVAGVAPGASLYAVKVLDAKGNGAYSAIIGGLQWAVDNGMNVANMSLGAPSGSPAMRKAVAAAYKAGLTLVMAAGNDGGPVNYPARYPQAIAVSASDSGDRLASFSSRGPEIAVIAPGVAINSTYMGGGYKSLSGTSMASPHVAGLAALAVARGAKTPAAVRAALTGAAAGIGLQASEQGAGLVDAARLVK